MIPDAASATSTSNDTGGDDQPAAPRRRAWVRRTLLWLGLVAVGVVVGSLVFGGSAPVGHFRSAEGQDAYLDSYERALAEGPAPSGEFDLMTEYGTVHVLAYGTDATSDAHPLVLLPGTQSGAPMWVDNVPSLSENRPVYVIDLLGQPGRSIQSRPITGHADDARWLAQLLDQLPGERPDVLGHSLGGWLAMNLAVHEPQAAGSIIVLDPVMTFTDLSPEAVIRSIPASVSWTPREWRDSFASWTANDAPVEAEPVADMIEAGMQHYSLGTPGPTRFTEEQLAGVDVPVLAIMAGSSRMHDSAEAAQYAKDTLPLVTVHTYPDASHAINGEEPERIADDIDAFLSRDNR